MSGEADAAYSTRTAGVDRPPARRRGTPVRLAVAVESPGRVDEDQDWKDHLNPDSLRVLAHCKLEPSLKDLEPGERVQFERVGYFVVDTRDSKPGAPVFNRTVPLRDSWAKLEKRLQAGG